MRFDGLDEGASVAQAQSCCQYHRMADIGTSTCTQAGPKHRPASVQGFQFVSVVSMDVNGGALSAWAEDSKPLDTCTGTEEDEAPYGRQVLQAFVYSCRSQDLQNLEFAVWIHLSSNLCPECSLGIHDCADKYDLEKSMSTELIFRDLASTFDNCIVGLF